MKSKPIGIIGGAGPMAGALLLERVLSLAGSLYGCYRDADFPEVFLLSFPFSEMLTAERDVTKLQKELGGCLNRLRANGAAVLAIACNSLHAFLNEDDEDIIYLPRVVSDEIPKSELPLILCTSTSVQFGVHKKFFPCVYPNWETQLQIDSIIDRILKGEMQIGAELLTIIRAQTAHTIVLGCTELSLFTKSLFLSDRKIIDPIEITAKKILEKSFIGEF